jgi:hypothetical protein
MNDFVKRAMSFIAFDGPLHAPTITEQLCIVQQAQSLMHPYWCIQASRRKLIFNYWYRQVINHFLLLYLFAVLVTWLLRGDTSYVFAFTALLVGLISMVVLILFNYLPSYQNQFLPALESAIERWQREKLVPPSPPILEHPHEDAADLISTLGAVTKARKAQYSVLGLALILYACDKAMGLNIQCNMKHGLLLGKLMGVNGEHLKNKLARVYGRKQEYSTKAQIEIQKSFDEAENFFEELDYKQGITILSGLQRRMLN